MANIRDIACIDDGCCVEFRTMRNRVHLLQSEVPSEAHESPSTASANTPPFSFSTTIHRYDETDCDSASRRRRVTAHLEGVRYYGLRYYNPELGRWINRDPIGEIPISLQIMNCYSLLNNNTCNEVDFIGLMELSRIERKYTENTYRVIESKVWSCICTEEKGWHWYYQGITERESLYRARTSVTLDRTYTREWERTLVEKAIWLVFEKFGGGEWGKVADVLQALIDESPDHVYRENIPLSYDDWKNPNYMGPTDVDQGCEGESDAGNMKIKERLLRHRKEEDTKVLNREISQELEKMIKEAKEGKPWKM